jgi:hypothetical protein
VALPLGQLVEEQHAAVRERDLARPRRLPPPTIAAALAVWCGARNGRSRQRDASKRAAIDAIAATSSASSSSSGGSNDGAVARASTCPRPAVRTSGARARLPRDLERALRQALAADVGEIGHRRARRDDGSRPRASATAHRPTGARTRRAACARDAPRRRGPARLRGARCGSTNARPS